MPKLTHRAPGKIDFLGAALLVVTFVPLLLALSSGGRSYGWTSPQILGLLAIAALGLAGFLVTESRVSNPILSLGLFRNRVFSTGNAANFVINMAFMGAVTFMPLYMQLGQGVAATTSGLSMLPLMLGMIATSTLVGQLIGKTGQYKPFMLIGTAIMALGLFAISRVGPETTTWDLAWRVLLMGIGLGPSMSTFNIAIQNAVPKHQIGVSTSSTQFFRQIGGTVGVALFGAILTHNLAAGAMKVPAQPGAQVHVMDLSDLQRLALGASGDAPSSSIAHAATPVKVDVEVRKVVVTAITGVFTVSVGVTVLAFLLILLIPALPLESRRGGPPPPPAAVEGAAEGLAEAQD